MTRWICKSEVCVTPCEIDDNTEEYEDVIGTPKYCPFAKNLLVSVWERIE